MIVMVRQLLVVVIVACAAFATAGSRASAQTPSAQLVIDALVVAGVEAASPTAIGPERGIPALCDGLQFGLPALGPDQFGYAYYCGAAADQRQVATFWTRSRFRVAQSGPFAVVLPAQVEPRTARTYQAALLKIPKPPRPTAVPRPTRAPRATTVPRQTPVAGAPAQPSAPVYTGSGRNRSVSPPHWPCAPGQIKANKSSRIYHVTGGASYAKTFVNVTCYNTDAEARANGFRAAQR